MAVTVVVVVVAPKLWKVLENDLVPESPGNFME